MAALAYNPLRRKPEGEEHHAAILTEADVAEARRLRKEQGFPYSWLAYEFGVENDTIYQAVTGITWKCVSEPPAPVGNARKRLYPWMQPKGAARVTELLARLVPADELAEYGL